MVLHNTPCCMMSSSPSLFHIIWGLPTSLKHSTLCHWEYYSALRATYYKMPIPNSKRVGSLVVDGGDRATSHMRLRAHDHHTSSTPIGGKGGAGPSLLHTTPEGSTYEVCECKMDGKVYMDSYMASNVSCFMVAWTIFRNHLLEVSRNTKLGDHGTPIAHNRWFILSYHV